MSALAKLILALDRKWPGDTGAPMELPAKEWQRLVELAKKSKKRRKAGAK